MKFYADLHYNKQLKLFHNIESNNNTSQSTYNASLPQIDNDKRNSSCVTLQLPMNLACDHCKKKLDPLTFNRQKKLKKTTTDITNIKMSQALGCKLCNNIRQDSTTQ